MMIMNVIFRNVPVMWSLGGLSLAMIAGNSIVFAKVTMMLMMMNMMNMMMMMMMMMATCPVGCTSSPGDCRPAWSNASEPGPLQDHHRNHDGYKYPNLHISKSKYQYKSIKDQNPCFQISLVTGRPGKEGRRLWPDSHHVVARHQLTLAMS